MKKPNFEIDLLVFCALLSNKLTIYYNHKIPMLGSETYSEPCQISKIEK